MEITMDLPRIPRLDVPLCEHPPDFHQTGNPMVTLTRDSITLKDACPLAWCCPEFLWQIKNSMWPHTSFTYEQDKFVLRVCGTIWVVLEYHTQRDCYLIGWPD